MKNIKTVSDLSRRIRFSSMLCRLFPIFVAQRMQQIMIPWAKLRKHSIEIVSKSITGSKLVVNISDYHGAKYVIQGYFDWRNLAIAKAVCRPGDSIIEIGANVGTESVGFRDIVGDKGKLILFEPLPKNVRMLEKMVTINNWNNVHVYKTAIGNTSGHVNFIIPPHASMSGIGFIDMGQTSLKEDRKLKVPIRPLDEFIDHLSNLKIVFSDTEGHECFVLSGAKQIIEKFRPMLVVEASPKLLARSGSSIEELVNILDKFNYSYWEVSRFGLIPPKKYKQLKATNWVCIPQEQAALKRHIERNILLAGFMPRIKNLNPLVK